MSCSGAAKVVCRKTQLTNFARKYGLLISSVQSSFSHLKNITYAVLVFLLKMVFWLVLHFFYVFNNVFRCVVQL